MKYLIALIVAHAHPSSVPPQQLANEIIKVCVKYNLSPVEVVQIVMVESGGNPNATNARTHDYGLMQINYKTALAMQVSDSCLRNWRCNLDAGARILRDLKRHKHYRLCMYNVGPKRYNSKKCYAYEQKLAKIN